MTTRRRFLAISAAASAFPAASQAQPMHTWQGIALGARATIRLSHPNARAICDAVAAEISRLEDIFSLYRPDSALSQLNRTGALQSPSFELLECLSLAGSIHHATGGRFDPTIQPLWATYAAANGAHPSKNDITNARVSISWSDMHFSPEVISLKRGMALSLNGIAQGYIADRVAQFLKAKTLTNILIDTGELRALGTHPDGGAWPVKLAAGGEIALSARALATSAPLGTTFDEAGQAGHILDPVTGLPTEAKWKEITVSANSAALADGLSTAACLYETRSEIATCLSHFKDVRLEAIS
jgi:thiamine biosynthesis lipoprotein